MDTMKIFTLNSIFSILLSSFLFLNEDSEIVNNNSLDPKPTNKVELTVSKLDNTTFSLKWTLEKRYKIDHFLIQKSNDKKRFTTIGKVACDKKNTYHFQEYIPKAEIIIYRLVTVNNDGTFNLSQNLTVVGS